MNIQQIAVLMILGHMVADYTLQGWLANAKQSKWWRENAPQPLYRFDYLAGLACHALYWSAVVFLPLFNHRFFLAAVVANAVVHAVIDHAKANMRAISLVQDQLLHLAQIGATITVMTVLA